MLYFREECRRCAVRTGLFLRLSPEAQCNTPAQRRYQAAPFPEKEFWKHDRFKLEQGEKSPDLLFGRSSPAVCRVGRRIFRLRINRCGLSVAELPDGMSGGHWIFRDRHGGLYDPFSGRHTPPSAGRAGIPAPHLSGARPEQSGAPYLGADRQNGESGLFQLPGGRIGADAQCRGKPQLAVGGFKGGSPVAMGISGGPCFL